MSDSIPYFQSKNLIYFHSRQAAILFDCSHQRVLEWVRNELPPSMRDMVMPDLKGTGFNIDTDLIFSRDGVMH